MLARSLLLYGAKEVSGRAFSTKRTEGHKAMNDYFLMILIHQRQEEILEEFRGIHLSQRVRSRRGGVINRIFGRFRAVLHQCQVAFKASIYDFGGGGLVYGRRAGYPAVSQYGVKNTSGSPAPKVG